MSAHVAFDLGASNGRAILGRYDGAAIELEEVHRFATPSARLPDGLYWDALGMYRELIGSVAGLGDVRSIGIDSWGVDFGLLDDHGALVANPLSYRDGRAADHVTVALRRVPADELYAATGIQLLPINTLFQLLAAEENVERAETMLLIPDLLAYWLTGERRGRGRMPARRSSSTLGAASGRSRSSTA